MYAVLMITDEIRASLQKTIDESTLDQLWYRAEKLIRANDNLSTENHYIGGNGAWSVKRKHKKFIEQIVDTLAVPCEAEAAIVGGMPGAGKSKMLAAFFNPAHYYVIDPDDIKQWLVENDLYVDVPGLTPLETGPLLHVESTVIAKKLSEALLSKKANIIWPLTFSSADPVNNRIAMAKSAGYNKIDGAYVQVSLDTSSARVKSRYEEGMRSFAQGNGLGGRFIDLGAVKRNPSPGLFNSFSPHFKMNRILNNDMDLL